MYILKIIKINKKIEFNAAETENKNQFKIMEDGKNLE